LEKYLAGHVNPLTGRSTAGVLPAALSHGTHNPPRFKELQKNLKSRIKYLEVKETAKRIWSGFLWGCRQ
jgi:hypothetical protein